MDMGPVGINAVSDPGSRFLCYSQMEGMTLGFYPGASFPRFQITVRV